MFKKILVALDRSSEAEIVFDFALSVAQPEIAQLFLVHFINWQTRYESSWVGIGTLSDINISGDRSDRNRERLQEAIAKQRSWLQDYARRAIAKGINCESECRIGNCNLGIGNFAKEWNADLIVIGRRGHKNISEIFLGSVSNYVIHHAPCSVLLVRETSKSETDELDRATEVS